jgi:hypothetical protein
VRPCAEEKNITRRLNLPSDNGMTVLAKDGAHAIFLNLVVDTNDGTHLAVI